MGDEVIVLDLYVSVFCMRVRVALAEKGIEYECREEESLGNKTPYLLEMNPVYKKIPVLIHNDKPICESLIIVEYIDEFWKHKSPLLLPCDPHQRAQARFWAHFIDKKVHEAGKTIFMTRKGEERESAKKELIDALKLLEGELGDKPYFGGHNFGFLDVAFIVFQSLFHTYETYGNFSIQKHCPKLIEWAKRCMLRESVSKSLAHPNEVYEYILNLTKKHGLE